MAKHRRGKRKTFKRKALGRSVYKVRGGWRLGKR